MGCDYYKDSKVYENAPALTKNVEVFGHSLEKMQDIQRHQAYLEIREYGTIRSFLFQPVTLTVTSDKTFVAEGVTKEGTPVEIKFDSRKKREFSFRNYVNIANVKQWPKTADVETATP